MGNAYKKCEREIFIISILLRVYLRRLKKRRLVVCVCVCVTDFHLPPIPFLFYAMVCDCSLNTVANRLDL